MISVRPPSTLAAILLAACGMFMSDVGKISAALIQVHDTDYDFLGTPQDGYNITKDTTHHVQWLDWRLTTSRSYDDVYAETQGGNLDGWRYALEADFVNLATEAGMPTTFFDATPGGTHPAFALLNTLMGSNLAVGETAAISGVSLGAGTHAAGGFRPEQDTFELPNAVQITWTAYQPDSVSSSRFGHALIRDVVPEPSALLLVSLCALVPILFRRKLCGVASL